ncbi:hypothetical protein KC963_03705 [Candidatus Saccharibacteria bacterium]|nr:hypothetical protein [Candidatus Saccharibacteria bacterium]
MIDGDNVVFNSNWAAYKNFDSGTATLTPTASTIPNGTRIWSTNIAHNAGRPVPFIVYLQNDFNWGLTPSTALMSFDIGLDSVNFAGICTDNELQISIIHSDTSGLTGVPTGTTYTFKYFIFYD